MSSTTATTTDAGHQPAARRRARRSSAPATGPAGPRCCPALIFTILMTQLPFVATIVISFMNWNAYYPDERGFAGVDNFARVFTDTNTRKAVWVTILLTVSVVLICLVLGLGIALLLDRKFRGQGIVRTMMITPFLIVPVAAALLWKHALYNPEYGLFNGLLKTVFGDNAPQPDWITNNPLAAIIAALVWQWTPFMMLILLAGLQSRPLDVVEAARIDGASAWQIFTNMTLPAPAPVHRAVRPARRHLRGAELRPRLHDHLGRTGHGEPAVLHLPDLLHRPGLRPGLSRRRRRGHRHDHHRDRRAADRVQPVQGGLMTITPQVLRSSVAPTLRGPR